MRIINELNKLGKQLLADTRPDGHYVSGAPPPPDYARPRPPQHAMSYPPPPGHALSLSYAPPAGLSYAPPSPMPPSDPYMPQHQGTWPPPNGPIHPQQSPPFSPPGQFGGSSAPSNIVGYSSPPQSYTPASPPQTYHSPPSFASYPSPPLSAPHSSPPQSFSPPQYPFGPTPGLSPSSTAAPSPHTPHSLSHSQSISHPPNSLSIHPTQAATHDPADWLAALQALLPSCLTAARDHVASAHTQPDTIWLYFLDLGAGTYFADAVYGVDGNAFAKDDLAWAGVPPSPERSAALYRVLAGEWVTKICMRSRVEEVHPSRVVVKVDVGSGAFGSTMCYEVGSVRHPTLSPAQVLTLWVGRLKSTGNDSAEFMPA